jgi:hypothetical protein
MLLILLKHILNLQWKDCADTVEMDKYWYDPSTSAFKKLPEAVDQSTAGELAVDAEGKCQQKHMNGTGIQKLGQK